MSRVKWRRRIGLAATVVAIGIGGGALGAPAYAAGGAGGADSGGEALPPLVGLSATYDEDDTEILESIRVEAEESEDTRAVEDPWVRVVLRDEPDGDVARTWNKRRWGSLRSWVDGFDAGLRAPEGELCATVFEHGKPIDYPTCMSW